MIGIASILAALLSHPEPVGLVASPARHPGGCVESFEHRVHDREPRLEAPKKRSPTKIDTGSIFDRALGQRRP